MSSTKDLLAHLDSKDEDAGFRVRGVVSSAAELARMVSSEAGSLKAAAEGSSTVAADEGDSDDDRVTSNMSQIEGAAAEVSRVKRELGSRVA